MVRREDSPGGSVSGCAPQGGDQVPAFDPCGRRGAPYPCHVALAPHSDSPTFKSMMLTTRQQSYGIRVHRCFPTCPIKSHVLSTLQPKWLAPLPCWPWISSMLYLLFLLLPSLKGLLFDPHPQTPISEGPDLVFRLSPSAPFIYNILSPGWSSQVWRKISTPACYWLCFLVKNEDNRNYITLKYPQQVSPVPCCLSSPVALS